MSLEIGFASPGIVPVTIFVPTATIETTVTITTQYEETFSATIGETLTIDPIQTSFMPTSTATSLSQLTTSITTETVTVTDVVVVILNQQSSQLSTWTTPIATSNPDTPPKIYGSPVLLVIGSSERENNGWSSWSSAAQAGLIAGVTIAGTLLILSLLYLCWARTSQRTWIANDWSTRSYPAVGVYEPGQVAYPGYTGWGLRGGGHHNTWQNIKAVCNIPGRLTGRADGGSNHAEIA